MAKIKLAFPFIIVVLLLIFTRFVNVTWGLPYPFHPDERNMANAAQNLSCPNLVDLKNCFNPRFFAYGQFPLYLGHALIGLMKFFNGNLGAAVSFEEAAIALRLISVFASIFTSFFGYRILQRVFFKDQKINPFIVLLFVFSPGLIQFAHFGTTESLLILFFTWLVYESLLYLNNLITPRHFTFIVSLVAGVAVATKVSSLIFLAIPLGAFIANLRKEAKKLFKFTTLFLLLFILFAAIFSPHNIISFNEAASTIRYESNVALGKVDVFYTRQFKDSIPVVFQFFKIFPYALGIPTLLFFLVGYFILPRNQNFNFLRYSFLIYFLPAAFVYAKWTRFMAPIFPLMILFSALTLYRLYSKKLLFYLTLFVLLIPGIAFLSIYTNQDVRYKASDWIYQKIPAKSYILSETANVVDLPVGTVGINYNYTPFDFYDLEDNPKLQDQLQNHLQDVNYILIPSRRLFMNANPKYYPELTNYYQKLFSGDLGFKKVVEFSSYPRIELFGKILLEFPDEQAEETFTVFDHPVIRVYKKQ